MRTTGLVRATTVQGASSRRTPAGRVWSKLRKQAGRLKAAAL
jgi:hypothetical protein